MSVHAAPADVTISPVATPGRRRAHRAARATSLALAAVATIGVLAGCDGGSATSTSASARSSADSASSAGGSSKAPYTDAAACAWLKSSMPKAADPIMAEAGLAMDLATFFDQNGGLANADGYAYDEAVARGCPELRAKALKRAGLGSFGEI